MTVPLDIDLRRARFRSNCGSTLAKSLCDQRRGAAHLGQLRVERHVLAAQPGFDQCHPHFQRLLLDIRRAIREDAWSFLAEGWPVAFEGADHVGKG